MAKQEYDWVESFQRGLGKKVSLILFSKPLSREKLTELIYPDSYKKYNRPNRAYINRHINELCNKWNEKKFIDKVSITKKDRLGRKITVYLEWLNFKPLFLYFKDKHKITFTKEEEQFIENKEPRAHFLQWNRDQILHEYPDENIFNAIIKFYVKHYCIPSVELLDENKNEIWMMTKKHIETELKYAEDLKKGVLKKRKKPSVLRTYMGKLDAKNLPLEERREWSQNFHNLFLYILNFQENPTIVPSINLKFKRALGIQPN